MARDAHSTQHQARAHLQSLHLGASRPRVRLQPRQLLLVLLHLHPQRQDLLLRLVALLLHLKRTTPAFLELQMTEKRSHRRQPPENSDNAAHLGGVALRDRLQTVVHLLPNFVNWLASGALLQQSQLGVRVGQQGLQLLLLDLEERQAS